MISMGQRSWVRIALAACILASILGALYVKTSRYSDSAYLENIARLRQAKQFDAQWQLDVLESRMGIESNYDSLVGASGDLGKLLDESDAALASQAHPEPVLLAQKQTELRSSVREKGELIERFKSVNALLRNSLVYLPTATEKVQEAIEQARQSKAVSEASAEGALADVHRVLLLCMLYSQNATEAGKDGVTRAIILLEGDRARLTEATREPIGVMMAHARTVAREQERINQMIADIGAVPTGPRIEAMADALSREQGSAATDSRTYRRLLLAFSALLIGLLIYAAARLIRSHEAIQHSRDQLREYGHSLEVKVAERVSELRDSEERMARLAQFDSLTGLPNRVLFRDRLSQALLKADRNGLSVVLMFIDLDHFKQINDSLGHDVGDSVLKAVAERFRQTLRESDTVARLGGDEFTVILENVLELEHAGFVAHKLRIAVAKPLVADGREFNISASIGVAVYPSGAQDAERLLQAADIAMYRAKEQGRNAHALFAPEMAQAIGERVRMGEMLRQALARDEFELHYQPKVSISDGTIVGVEALLRWNSTELGSVSPAQFIPLAEELGLIVPIGEWVLVTACRQVAKWSSTGLPALVVAVNLSPRQLREPRLLDQIATALRESQLPAERLELELTEGVIMENVKGNIDVLDAIRSLGVRLAVDDFGTGYSSLAYLARLPIHTLKIDRTFISTMIQDSDAMTLVTTMVTLAHSLRLNVVAEGVETELEYDALQAIRCDEVQGYLTGRPTAPENFEAMICAHAVRPTATRAVRYA